MLEIPYAYQTISAVLLIALVFGHERMEQALLKRKGEKNNVLG